MIKLYIYLSTWVSPKYLDIFSGLVDWWQKTTGSGDYSSKKLSSATQALQNAAPYLHYDDFLGRLVNQFKWAIVKFFYGLANWASELATDSLNFSKILQSTGLNHNLIAGVMTIASGLMILTLTWIGIKIGTSSRPPKIKNVVWQLVISAFLITNIQSISNWVVDQSTGIYKGFTQTDSQGTSSLPYQIVQSNSNDLLAIIAHNFSSFKINNGNTKTSWDGVSKDKDGDIKDQRGKSTHWGSLMMDKTDFETASAGDLSTTISSDLAKQLSNKANKSKEKPAWDPDNLRYKLTPSGAGTSSSSGKSDSYAGYSAGKVTESNLAFFKIFNGGYERYSVSFLPVIIALISITVAFLLVTFVSVRAFLELAIMQVLSIIIFSTDLETGQKTKEAVQDIFNSALLIAFQGFELAFYRIAASWMSSSQAKGISDNPYLYAVGMIALTFALFEGSSKIQKFFGIDTGLKEGWQKTLGTASVGAMAGAKMAAPIKGAAHMTGQAGKGVAKAGHSYKTAVQAHAVGNKAYDDAKESGATDALAKQTSDYAKQAFKSQKKDFINNGGSRKAFNRAYDSGVAANAAISEAHEMQNNGGINNKEKGMLKNAEPMTAKGSTRTSTSGANNVNSTSQKGNGSNAKKETANNTEKIKPESASRTSEASPKNEQNKGIQPSKQSSKNNIQSTKTQSTAGNNSMNSNTKPASDTTSGSKANVPNPTPTSDAGRHISDIKGKDKQIDVTKQDGATNVKVNSRAGQTRIQNSSLQADNLSSIKSSLQPTTSGKTEHITTTGANKNVDVTKSDTTSVNVKHTQSSTTKDLGAKPNQKND